LREGLDTVAVRLGVDLRAVQESVVEHAAMYASCPEVLGGMLQLVFCLDLLGTWIKEQDNTVNSYAQRLQVIEEGYCMQGVRLAELASEVRACGERAAELELSGDLVRAIKGGEKRGHSHLVPMPQRLAVNLIGMDDPFSDTDGSAKAASMAAATHAMEMEHRKQLEVREAAHRAAATEVEELKQENAALREEVTEAQASAAAAACSLPLPGALQELQELQKENLALRQRLTATPPAESELALVRGPLDSSTSPAQKLLLLFMQLEPILAALPASVPGMMELQEEACEAYGHLRSVVLEASSMQHAPMVTVPGASGVQGYDSRDRLPLTYRSGGTSEAMDTPASHTPRSPQCWGGPGGPGPHSCGHPSLGSTALMNHSFSVPPGQGPLMAERPRMQVGLRDRAPPHSQNRWPTNGFDNTSDYARQDFGRDGLDRVEPFDRSNDGYRGAMDGGLRGRPPKDHWSHSMVAPLRLS